MTAMNVALDDLIQQARALTGASRRVILGITGTRGAGKSTLCAALLDTLGEDAVLVGMDGFHLANQELVRLGRRDRKGAPTPSMSTATQPCCCGCANRPTARSTPHFQPRNRGVDRQRVTGARQHAAGDHRRQLPAP
jgi:hypothetical protein